MELFLFYFIYTWTLVIIYFCFGCFQLFYNVKILKKRKKKKVIFIFFLTVEDSTLEKIECLFLYFVFTSKEFTLEILQCL